MPHSISAMIHDSQYLFPNIKDHDFREKASEIYIMFRQSKQTIFPNGIIFSIIVVQSSIGSTNLFESSIGVLSLLFYILFYKRILLLKLEVS